jgi:hypothetical protein
MVAINGSGRFAESALQCLPLVKRNLILYIKITGTLSVY